VGNDCILCLSLYALMVPSYPPPPPPPPPIGHQPRSPPCTPFTQPRVPSSPSPCFRVSFTLIHTSTQCCWSQCLCGALANRCLQTDHSEGIRGPYVWMSHGPAVLSHTAELDGGVSVRRTRWTSFFFKHKKKKNIYCSDVDKKWREEMQLNII